MENQKIQLSVSEFVALTNQVLDGAYPDLAVVGEVTSFTVNQGKFVFFDLKDEASTVNCFMMVWQLRTPIEDGMTVRITGTPKVTAKGRFSITVRSVQPVGEGNLRKSFELLRAKLADEGLFDESRKRPLPAEPARIALISSPQAAGYADFIEMINQRWGNVAVTVAATAVQGESALDQIIRAIDYFNQAADPADVLVIVRGGGSADDLATFNDETLVRAIAGSRIPTLVGIGHETDTSLVDLAADVRAVTPTHAAQLVVPDREVIVATMRRRLLSITEDHEAHISQTQAAIRQRMTGVAVINLQRITEYASEVTQTMKLLQAYSPASILARGYAIVRGERRAGAMIDIELATQTITAEVQHVTEK